MSNELTSRKAPTTVMGLLSLDSTKEQIAMALPKHLTPERMIRSLRTCMTRVPKLKDCTLSSFAECMMGLSQVGLEPDGRRAHLIPYGKTCTLIIDYKGLVELVRRNEDVETIHTDVICENDVFRHSLGKVLEHTYEMGKPRGKVIGAFSRVTFKSGGEQCEVMDVSEIEAIRKASKAGNSGPWKDHYNAMCRKTVFKRGAKWITLPNEAHTVLQTSDDNEFRNVTPARQQEVEVANAFNVPTTTEEETDGSAD